MDEYGKEIGDLQAQIEAMVEAEEDAKAVRELEMQLEVLRAIYRQAVGLEERGSHDPDLKAAFAMRGFGEWNLDNVYAFVYETAVELPAAGHREFVRDIVTTDFTALLEA